MPDAKKIYKWDSLDSRNWEVKDKPVVFIGPSLFHRIVVLIASLVWSLILRIDTHLANAYGMRGNGFIQIIPHSLEASTDLKPMLTWVNCSCLHLSRPLWGRVPDSGLLYICFVEWTSWPSFKQSIGKKTSVNCICKRERKKWPNYQAPVERGECCRGMAGAWLRKNHAS